MASIYQVKPAFQALLRPATCALAARGVTANQVTVAAMLLSFAVGGAMAARPESPRILLLVPATLLARMALNAVDGMLASEHGMKTSLGAVLNELGDVFSDAALYLPFALLPGAPGPLVFAVVLLAVIGELAGVLGAQIGASRRYDGPLGKSDRAFVFGALALAFGFGVKAGAWTTALLAAMVLLSLATILNRVRGALGELR